MDVSIVTPASIRIKGKQVSFLVDPVATRAKQEADAVLLTHGNTITTNDIEGVRLTMSGPGEYEVGGVKITGVRSGEGTVYYFIMDSISVLVATANSLKGKESSRDVGIALINSDGLTDQSALATVDSNVVLFYGQEAAANVKALGKDLPAVTKYTTTKEKLPQEMEVVLLG